MKYVFFMLLLSLMQGQSLDDMYHSTDEVYEFLDTLDQSVHVGHLVHLGFYLLARFMLKKF